MKPARALLVSFPLIFGLLSLGGCDVDIGKQTFKLQMLGVEAPAEGASGDASPKSLTYTLTGIRFTAEDGGSDLNFELKDPEKTYRIVNRPQILFAKDLTVDEETSYQNATLTFGSAVTGETTGGGELSFTMANPSLVSEAFSLKKGRDLNIIIKVNWQNTVSGDSITEPSTSISVTH